MSAAASRVLSSRRAPHLCLGRLSAQALAMLDVPAGHQVLHDVAVVGGGVDWIGGARRGGGSGFGGRRRVLEISRGALHPWSW